MEKGMSRAALPVTPPPHGLSRGKRARSSSKTLAPASASRKAAVDPAGPAPTTIVSKCRTARSYLRPRTGTRKRPAAMPDAFGSCQRSECAARRLGREDEPHHVLETAPVARLQHSFEPD